MGACGSTSAARVQHRTGGTGLEKCIEDVGGACALQHSDCTSQTTSQPPPTLAAKEWKHRAVLGAGRFGKVMLAERKTGYGSVQRAAIKQIVHADTRPCYLEAELFLLQRANSPSSGVRDHIVQLIEHATDSKRTTLAFEHCEMGDLLKYLQDHGNVPAFTAQACIISILKAVRFLHQLGYAHRDIKPDNILLQKPRSRRHSTIASKSGAASMPRSSHSQNPRSTSTTLTTAECSVAAMSDLASRSPTNALSIIAPDDSALSKPSAIFHAKLADLGLARKCSAEHPVPTSAGTLHYSSPAQILPGRRGYHQPCDMWAVGVLTYVVLTGQHPFCDLYSDSGTSHWQKSMGWAKLNESVKSYLRQRYQHRSLCYLAARIYCSSANPLPSTAAHNVSAEALDFMDKLLVRRPAQRMTAEQALQHPWLKCDALLTPAPNGFATPFVSALDDEDAGATLAARGMRRAQSVGPAARHLERKTLEMPRIPPDAGPRDCEHMSTRMPRCRTLGMKEWGNNSSRSISLVQHGSEA